jgi:hypothetical protein
MKITRDFLTSLTFRVMTPSDIDSFAGCDSPVPLIAEQGDYIIVIDGDCCEVFGPSEEGTGEIESVAFCPNIRNLR